MKKLIIYIMFFTALVSVKATEFSVYEANYPNVKDYNVNIDEATLVIHPAGTYVEMNLYLTVSYDFNSWFFKNYNELEFLWEFNLPEDAIVHQFWYWQGDSIIQADIMDKWTAELLFSNVSNPVRNPGLLTQSFPIAGQAAYQLRLFPIMRDEKRKCKIQYLLPGRPTGDKLRVWLPMTQLVSNKTRGIDQLKILYKYGSEPYEPKIIGTNVLSSKNNTDLQEWETDIPVSYNQFVELELPSPLKNNKPFFSTYTQGDQSFYHLAVNPPEAPKISKPRNVLFAIDFNRYNTNELDGDFLLSYLKESLMQAFNESDSINVIAAYDEIVSGGNKWNACSRDGIDSLFEKVMMRSFPSYNNLLPLISRAANFINTQSGTSEVLFLTNTNTINLYGDDRIQLADEVVRKFKPGTKIHFIDLDNKGYLVYNNGYYETQMQSFYGRITYPASGNLFFLRYNSLKQMLYSFLYDEISHYENVEVQMRFQNGYAYNKHLIAQHEGYYPLNTPIMQVGEFSGELPVEITVLGRYRNITEKYTTTITNNDSVPGSEQIATSWYGGKIQSMLQLSYSPITVADIIDLSIQQSILTPYSGFLIYNLDENHGYCQDCNDETPDMTSVNEETKKDSVLSVDVSVFPNPFNPTTTIGYELPDRGHIKIIVFNILGEKVNELVDDIKNSGKYSVSFDGSRLSSGVYILTVAFETASIKYLKTKKMILMK